jgi:hypothetical protein
VEVVYSISKTTVNVGEEDLPKSPVKVDLLKLVGQLVRRGENLAKSFVGPLAEILSGYLEVGFHLQE